MIIRRIRNRHQQIDAIISNNQINIINQSLDVTNLLDQVDLAFRYVRNRVNSAKMYTWDKSYLQAFDDLHRLSNAFGDLPAWNNNLLRLRIVRYETELFDLVKRYRSDLISNKSVKYAVPINQYKRLSNEVDSLLSFPIPDNPLIAEVNQLIKSK